MAIEHVCSSCFEDDDLRAWIRDGNGPRGCDACGQFDSPTRELLDICDHIQSCLQRYWGYAVEQLPYETAEGGYQGMTWTTAEILDSAGVSLPRDTNDRLYDAVLAGLTDELWCEYDWLTLDDDVALQMSWARFGETVKHRRRFFFHLVGTDDRDSYTPASLLKEIARISETMGLIRDLPERTRLWRARPDLARGRRAHASDFGPPPVTRALQSNRMNPPGIPMLYLASTSITALRETRTRQARVGQWQAARTLRVLDLRRLPRVPGIFSNHERADRLALRFLHGFADDIMIPVARDQRVHVDYLPSQVATEYFRDFDFAAGRLDGIAYPSVVHRAGWNVVLFADQVDLGLKPPTWGKPPPPWLHFVRSLRASV